MKNILATILSFLLFATACTQIEESQIPPDEQLEAGDQSLTRSTVISDQNPYSLENIQEAYDDLAAEQGLPSQTILASHHYVRFDIRDSLDYKIVHDSLGLELIEYPLDIDLTAAEMDEYMSDMTNTWYYTVVPSSFTYPHEVDYEFLDFIYMQSESLTRSDTPQISDDYYDLVIEQAMLNNGIDVAPPPLTRAGAWYPSATIEFQDDYDGNGDNIPDNNEAIPLEGVKVRCTHFVNVGSGTTNANGIVTGIKGWGGKFRNKVGYHIIWENSKWNIRDGKTGQAKTHGPKQKSHWDVTITNNDVKGSYFAAVHRALWAYFYETYPLTSGITKASIDKMDTAVLWDDEAPSRVGGFNPAKRTLGGNVIRLYSNDSNGVAIDRYAVTSNAFHELGHATHWQAIIDKRGVNRWEWWLETDMIIQDSWAEGVEMAYMRALYPGYLHGEYHGDYTAVVESMMNQGMTLKQIEDSFVGEGEWNNWRPKVLATGRIPAAIVNMIFDNRYFPLRINMTNLIMGANSPQLNWQTSYNIPIIIENTYNNPGNVPFGTSFNGWSVSGGTEWNDWQVIGSMNGNQLLITFKTARQFTLTANFTLPGSVPYSVTKTIDLTPPPPPVPVISTNKYNMTSRDYVTFSVSNHQSGTTYEWDANGIVVPYETGTSITLPGSWAQLGDKGGGGGGGGGGIIIIDPYAHQNGAIRAKCRAISSLGVSAWSNPITVPVMQSAMN